MRIDFSRLHWPQAVLLCVLWVSAVVGLVVLAITGSLEKVPAPAWALLGTLLTGGTWAGFMNSAVKPADEAAPLEQPTTRPRTRTLRGEDEDQEGGT